MLSSLGEKIQDEGSKSSDQRTKSASSSKEKSNM